MPPPLKNFVIAINGKPFIKGFDKDEIPDVRVDFKFKKFKPKRCKMCLIKKEADELVDDLCASIEDPAVNFYELTPQQRRDIIRGIVDNKMC